MHIFDFSTWGWHELDGHWVRVWKYTGQHLDGDGNVSAEGPLYVIANDDNMLLMISAALRDYHRIAEDV
jgi:hypothetical protein